MTAARARHVEDHGRPAGETGLFCDLHVHSTASDGTTAPQDLPDLARASQLAAIALTDHDTTDGLADCAAAAERIGLAFVPGIEISADPGPSPSSPATSPIRRGTLHILGLFVAANDAQLKQIQKRMRAARNSRNPAIVEKLNQLGVAIDYEEVLELARAEGTQIIGRPHIADVLTRRGYANSVQNAFSRYLCQGAPAYVRRDRLPAAHAIDAIHHAGGLAVMAHPVQLVRGDGFQLEQHIRRLKDIGLDGIETLHSDHTPDEVESFEDLATRYGLVTSGGSDFHGSRKSVALGSQQVPLAVYERLQEKRRA